MEGTRNSRLNPNGETKLNKVVSIAGRGAAYGFAALAVCFFVADTIRDEEAPVPAAGSASGSAVRTVARGVGSFTGAFFGSEGLGGSPSVEVSPGGVDTGFNEAGSNGGQPEDVETLADVLANSQPGTSETATEGRVVSPTGWLSPLLTACDLDASNPQGAYDRLAAVNGSLPAGADYTTVRFDDPNGYVCP